MFKPGHTSRLLLAATPLTAVSVLLLVVGGSARAENILINNGLDCSNPGNVIDDNTYVSDDVYVRNAGCPPSGAIDPDDPCPSPGVPTEVCVVYGGIAASYLTVMDSSTVTMSDGYILHGLYAYDNATVTMSGGEASFLSAWDSSTITVSGGLIWEGLYAQDSSTVMLTAGGFMEGLGVFDFSALTMSGGGAEWIGADDSSTVTMSGGVADVMGAYGSSAVTMSGGYIEWFLDAADSSTVTISGGGIAGGLAAYDSLAAYDNATVTVSGGWIYGGLYAYDSSRVTMSDGEIWWGGCTPTTPPPSGCAAG